MSKSNDARWSNYQSLGNYNKDQLGIPTGTKNFFQVVPYFSNMDYKNPNYSKLTNGSGNNYSSIAEAYPSVTVNYVKRACQ